MRRCLDSIIEQDYPYFEILAIDDSSSDDTIAIMKNIQKAVNKPLLEEKLKVLSAGTKPDNWTGKTWASQKGYKASKGDILLSTDADAYYSSKDVIYTVVSYMLKENLNVLSVKRRLELRDFWSRIVMPLMSFLSVIFCNSGQVNDYHSKIAYLYGSSFLVQREVFEKIGGYEAVKDAIIEDVVLGVILKKNGYRIRLVRIGSMMSAIWSRNRSTLWHNIARNPEKMNKILKRLIITFSMAVLPFIIGLSNLLFLLYSNPGYYTNLLNWSPAMNILLSSNVIFCSLMIAAVYINGLLHYEKMKGGYCFLSFFGALYLVIAYLYKMIPLLTDNHTRKILWKERTYEFK